jgi:hypothetical protein
MGIQKVADRAHGPLRVIAQAMHCPIPRLAGVMIATRPPIDVRESAWVVSSV